MTSKDLNLSFDQLQGAQTNRKWVPPPLQQVKNRPADGSTGSTIKMPERNIAGKTPQSRSSPLVAWVLALMLANILVLGAAGYWFYAHFGQLPAAAVPGPEIAVADGAALDGAALEGAALEGALEGAALDGAALEGAALASASLEAEFATLNRDLDSRLDRMQATLDEQRKLITSALLDLEEQVVVLLVQLAGQEVKEGQPSTAEIQPVPARWVINAGTFSNPERAKELVQRLMSMGYEARFGDDITGSNRGHRVQVAGFADRAAAEAVAKQIMKQTQLNGLWVWKDG